MKIAFLTPIVLFLLPLAFLPLLPRKVDSVPLSSLAPLSGMPDRWRERIALLRPWLCTLALLPLLLALAAPVLEERTRETAHPGVDLMLALDISASMAAADVKPDRITVARRAAADFLEQRRDDRVGVILFSGIPYLLSPPTLERGPVAARLRAVRSDRAGGGTAIGDALAASLARLKDSPARSKAVILLTDGTSNRDRVTPRAAARAAAALGIRVYAIGFGSAAGGEITLGPDEGPILLSDGKPLRDVLEEEPLREIARISGGRYFRADSGGSLADVYRQIDTLETSPLEIREKVAHTPLAAPLLALGAALTVLELLLFRIWLRRVP